MAVDTKIDQIEINGFTYDIDLPPDATPSIAGLTVTGNVSDGSTTKTMTQLLAGINVTPTAIGSATSSSNKFTFNLGTTSSSPDLSNGGGLGVFTFGNCMNLIPLFNLTSGTTYKTVGTFVYDSGGSVVTTTINYKYTKSSSVNTLEIWSGNADRKIVNSYTGYLFLTKLA